MPSPAKPSKPLTKWFSGEYRYKTHNVHGRENRNNIESFHWKWMEVNATTLPPPLLHLLTLNDLLWISVRGSQRSALELAQFKYVYKYLQLALLFTDYAFKANIFKHELSLIEFTTPSQLILFYFINWWRLDKIWQLIFIHINISIKSIQFGETITPTQWLCILKIQLSFDNRIITNYVYIKQVGWITFNRSFPKNH